MKMTILSGSDHIRFPTMINHKAYADRHGYRYFFDVSPRRDRINIYYHKLAAVADALPYTEWLFWIDDDAAFTQLDISLCTIVPELMCQDLSAIFCASPVNPAGGWTFLSSGNFFIRNDAHGRRLIQLALQTDLHEVQSWWDQETLGIFTHGDQDALVYNINENEEIGSRVAILDYQRFNTRPYHFDSASQHFLVHFTNLPKTTKEAQMADFCFRYNLTPHLLTNEDFAPYASYDDAQRKSVPWLG